MAGPRVSSDVVWAAVAVAVILAFTGACAGFVLMQFRAAEAEAQGIDTRATEEAVATLGDLGAIVGALSAPGALVVEDLHAAAAPLTDRAGRLMANGFAPDLAEQIAHRLSALVSVVHLIGLETAAGDLPARGLELARGAHTALSEAIAAEGQVQARSRDRLMESVKLMTLATLVLSGFFGVVSGGLVFLYKGNLREHARFRRAESRAQFLAHYDSLTGLLNRTGLQEAAGAFFENDTAPAVIQFDIHDFRQINEAFGHGAGDKVLCHVAKGIGAAVEAQGGLCARLGGDEFAALLPGPVSSMRAATLTERVNADIRGPIFHDGQQIDIVVASGIALFGSVGGDVAPTPEGLMKAAEVALAHAMTDGKPTMAFYDAALAAEEAARKRLEQGIDAALAADEFILAYQPQVDMETGQVTGFEALCRWEHGGEQVSPGDFIPVAEATGQVVEIDIAGLRKATAQLARWIRSGAVPVKVSANLSPLHFRSTRIVDEVASALSDSGLPPHLLTVEITETVLIDDLSSVTVILDRLRALGVRIALDDFGTGYSSLAYLRKLDVDFIKIDQSFVRDLEATGETRVILQALVDIARGLGKALIVEGIETEEQAEIIRELGCDLGQGYLFGKPLSVEEARQMVPDRLLPDAPTAPTGQA